MPSVHRAGECGADCRAGHPPGCRCHLCEAQRHCEPAGGQRQRHPPAPQRVLHPARALQQGAAHCAAAWCGVTRQHALGVGAAGGRYAAGCNWLAEAASSSYCRESLLQMQHALQLAHCSLIVIAVMCVRLAVLLLPPVCLHPFNSADRGPHSVCCCCRTTRSRASWRSTACPWRTVS